ncbi:MAG: trypsin-like serine peptidase [Actinomycetes bacterium]
MHTRRQQERSGRIGRRGTGRVRATVSVVGLAATMLVSAGAAAGAGAAPNQGTGGVRGSGQVAGGGSTGRAERVAGHWSTARQAAASPRDLVVDHRGLGYLRGAGGRLAPHGHARPAVAPPLAASLPAGADRPDAAAGPAKGAPAPDDTTPPAVSGLDPAAGATIGASHPFRATVTDAGGLRSVTFDVRSPSGGIQSFAAGQLVGTDVWGVDLTGFSDGAWSWRVVAKDTARKGGNTTTTDWTPFTVSTGGGTPPPPPPPSGTCGPTAEAEWTCAGAVQTAAGRVYFEMPANRKATRWAGYVCSGTAVTDGTTGRSLVLTAAHCVYDDVAKVFARNVLFIPDQAGTTGTGTDRDCTNDPVGCWAPTHGVVDVDWTTRTFPANIPWDLAYYVVPDSGAHSGNPATSDALDVAVGHLPVSDATPTMGALTHALGYSYSADPQFRYCAEGLAVESSYGDWWLGGCELSGGSSGGPWVQPMDTGAGSGPIVSVNSWGYSTQPGMGGPRLDTAEAACVLAQATTAGATSSRGTVVDC